MHLCMGFGYSYAATPGSSPPVHHPVPLLLGPTADYASYVLLLLSAACSLTHLAIGACVYLAAAGRPPRSFFRLLLSFEPLVGGCCPSRCGAV